MNLSRDVLSVLRKFVNDTDFYNLLITCKKMYRYFDKFAEQTCVKTGTWLGAELSVHDVKYMVMYNHVRKFEEFVCRFAGSEILFTCILKGYVYNENSYFMSNIKLTTRLFINLGFAGNKKTTDFINTSSFIKDDNLRKHYFRGLCCTSKTPLISFLIESKKITSSKDLNDWLEAGLVSACLNERWDTAQLLLNHGANTWDSYQALYDLKHSLLSVKREKEGEKEGEKENSDDSQKLGFTLSKIKQIKLKLCELTKTF